MIYAEKITTKEGIKEILEYRFPELKDAKIEIPEIPKYSCVLCKSNSAGPLIWLQNRLIESNQYYKATGKSDEFIDFVRIVGGKVYGNVARSKLFSKMPINYICPIDLTSLKVAPYPEIQWEGWV